MIPSKRKGSKKTTYNKMKKENRNKRIYNEVLYSIQSKKESAPELNSIPTEFDKSKQDIVKNYNYFHVDFFFIK